MRVAFKLAMPKKSSKKPRKNGVESAAHYAGVMLEEIRDKVQLVAESVQTTRESLEGRIEAVRGELKQDIADTRTGLDFKIEQVRKELSATKIELSQKIDQIGVRLNGHDEEIADLKKAQTSA